MRARSVRDIAARRYSPICRAVPSAVLIAMLPAEALAHHHVDGSLADVVALDEAHIVEERQARFAQDAPGLAHRLLALHFLDADIEQADGRALEIEQHARHRAAHHGKIDQMLGVRADRGADIEHDRVALDASATAPAIAGRSIPAMVRRLNFAIAIRAPVLPAETATSASPFFTASIASHIEDFQRPWRSAWLGLASIRTTTSVCTSREAAFSRGRASSSGRDHGLVAEQDEFRVGVAGKRKIGAGNHDRRPDVAPHGIERNSDLLGHVRPGKPSCDCMAQIPSKPVPASRARPRP